MVSPIFGISKREIHSEEVAYDHSCGCVQPGDHFTTDLSKVTCARCIKKFAKEVTPVSVEALEAELHFFRSAFPRAAANYKKVAAQQTLAPDAGKAAAQKGLFE
jgi:hypothetical protein